MQVDILFLSWERAEFTRTALRCLLEHTDLAMVRKLVVYDDGSGDEGRRSLARALSDAPSRLVVDTRFRNRIGPVGVLLDYLRHGPSDVFVKVDSDIAVPSGWLPDLLSAWDDQVELLGMEVGKPNGLTAHTDLSDGKRVWVPSTHIGGVGAMRATAFTSRPAAVPNGRFGFTEWQHQFRPKRGWVFPEVNAPCLDRIPVEPFYSLSRVYIERGWQRAWWMYPPEASRYWDWILDGGFA